MSLLAKDANVTEVLEDAYEAAEKAKARDAMRLIDFAIIALLAQHYTPPDSPHITFEQAVYASKVRARFGWMRLDPKCKRKSKSIAATK